MPEEFSLFDDIDAPVALEDRMMALAKCENEFPTPVPTMALRERWNQIIQKPYSYPHSVKGIVDVYENGDQHPTFEVVHSGKKDRQIRKVVDLNKEHIQIKEVFRKDDKVSYEFILSGVPHYQKFGVLKIYRSATSLGITYYVPSTGKSATNRIIFSFKKGKCMSYCKGEQKGNHYIKSSYSVLRYNYLTNYLATCFQLSVRNKEHIEKIEEFIKGNLAELAKNNGVVAPPDTLPLEPYSYYLLFPLFSTLAEHDNRLAVYMHENKAHVPATMTSIVRNATSIEDLAMSVFGNKGKVAKRLCVEAIHHVHSRNAYPNCNLVKLAVAKEFKNVMPVDYLYKIASWSKDGFSPRGSLDNQMPCGVFDDMRSNVYGVFLRKVAKKYGYRRTFNWAEQILNITISIDTVKLYHSVKDNASFTWPSKPSSFDEIHDHFARLNRRLSKEDYELEDRWAIKKFDGLEVNENVKLVVPKTHYELIEWGEHLNNCVGSYAKSIKNGNTHVIGVEKDGKLEYAIELTSQETGDVKIRQFCGKLNRRPDSQDESLVKGLLQDKFQIGSHSYV